jgi:hypothetical protein
LPALRLSTARGVGAAGMLGVSCATLMLDVRGAGPFKACNRRRTIDPVSAAPLLPARLAKPKPLPRRAAAQLLLGAALALVGGAAARADTVLEGVRFDARAAVAGRDLVLNGAGLRAAGWFKLYVAALYVPQRASTVEQVLAQGGAKRVRVVMLREAPAVELAKAMHKGMMRNAAPAEQAALQERLGALVAQINAVRDVRGGAVIDFDFDAARGTTTMLLDGRARGAAIAGADFYGALLRSFIGAHPYHRDLRAGMLGLPVAPKS